MALIYENNIPDIDRDSISLLRGGLTDVEDEEVVVGNLFDNLEARLNGFAMSSRGISVDLIVRYMAKYIKYITSLSYNKYIDKSEMHIPCLYVYDYGLHISSYASPFYGCIHCLKIRLVKFERTTTDLKKMKPKTHYLPGDKVIDKKNYSFFIKSKTWVHGDPGFRKRMPDVFFYIKTITLNLKTPIRFTRIERDEDD